MNVFFVAQRYHPFVGGVETQTRMVVSELAVRNHVEVAALTFREAAIPDRLRVIEDSVLVPSFPSYADGDIRIHSLSPSWTERARLSPIAVRAIPKLQRYYYQQLKALGYRSFRTVFIPKLRHLMRGFDVVHSVAGNYLGWAGQEAALDLGIPFICNPYVHPGQHGDDAASVEFYNRSDIVFALLDTDRQILDDLGVAPEKVRLAGVVPLLPAETNPERFRRIHRLDDAPIVLFVGRMVDYKGVSALLEAAPLVWETIPDVRFVFIGPASDSRARKMTNTDSRVLYLGRVDEEEKADALHACDIFCMPSVHEILPAVYLEAWTYARPVVGGMAPGLSDLIEGNEAGKVVEQDPRALAEVLLGLFSDPERRQFFGENGKRLVQSRYSKEALIGTYERAYEALTENRKRHETGHSSQDPHQIQTSSVR
ncbi:MAG: glycosyltransferase family 4 protein [Bacteroidetes bacterium]|nr:glycosyltransferase family 4 protein [Bacteroidota bacterium]